MSSRSREKGKGSGPSTKGESKSASSKSGGSGSRERYPVYATAETESSDSVTHTPSYQLARMPSRAAASFDSFPFASGKSIAREEPWFKSKVTPAAPGAWPDSPRMCGVSQDSSDSQLPMDPAAREQRRQVLAPYMSNNFPSAPPEYARSAIARETARAQPTTAAPKSPVMQKLSVDISSYGKRIPKNDVENLVEQLKDYRHMIAHALRAEEDFCGPDGWRNQKEERDDKGHIPSVVALDYMLIRRFADLVVEAIYRYPVVQRYEQFMCQKTGRYWQYLKQHAEDDALSAALTKGDYREFREWVELDEFCALESSRMREDRRNDAKLNEKVAKLARFEGITREAAMEKILSGEYIPKRQ